MGKKRLIDRLKLKDPSHRTIVAIWLGWAIVMLLFQAYVPARLELTRPDFALSWTPGETGQGGQAGRDYLTEPFLNAHVAWDSEFYLAIANVGYNDPAVRMIRVSFEDASAQPGFWPFQVPKPVADSNQLSLSYAFFPFYPLIIRFFAVPFSLLG